MRSPGASPHIMSHNVSCRAASKCRYARNRRRASCQGRDMGPYRVMQWATGKVGRRALAAIIDHPELELVGVYVHSPDKVGVDAGQLAGTADTGVCATNDLAVLLAERPHCVSFMAAQLDVDIVETFLRSGANVVTTSNGYLTGTNFGRGLRERLDSAARKGGATFMGTGFDPGFANLLAGVLTGACRRVHSVKLVETLDCAGYPDPDVWRSLGFGQPIRARRIGPLTMTPDGAPPNSRPTCPASSTRSTSSPACSRSSWTTRRRSLSPRRLSATSTSAGCVFPLARWRPSPGPTWAMRMVDRSSSCASVGR